ncbi:MAG: HK97 gp10 family phage protein [Hydrogenoanaerobacterium sp.]
MLLDPQPFREYLRKLSSAHERIKGMSEAAVNRAADRHLARCKKNTAVGTSPYSPTLRLRWDRSNVHFMSNGVFAEVFNPAEYAAYYEYGHRQKPGRLIFIEMRPGETKYGRAAKKTKSGKWGIYMRLKKSYVKGAFVMTDSEEKAQKELDNAVKRIEAEIRGSFG